MSHVRLHSRQACKHTKHLRDPDPRHGLARLHNSLHSSRMPLLSHQALSLPAHASTHCPASACPSPPASLLQKQTARGALRWFLREKCLKSLRYQARGARETRMLRRTPSPPSCSPSPARQVLSSPVLAACPSIWQLLKRSLLLHDPQRAQSSIVLPTPEDWQSALRQHRACRRPARPPDMHAEAWATTRLAGRAPARLLRLRTDRRSFRWWELLLVTLFAAGWGVGCAWGLCPASCTSSATWCTCTPGRPGTLPACLWGSCQSAPPSREGL